MHFKIDIFLPLFYTLKNSIAFHFDRGERIRNIFFIMLGLLFAVGMYLLSKFIVVRILSIDIIGEMVAKRTLSMLLMTLFFFVLFSSIITSLTSFYTADDLNIILSLPLGFESIFFSRFLKSLINSSIMPFGFILPVIFGFSSAMKSSLIPYIVSPFLLLFFFSIPVSIGSMIITLIVRIFPATRIKEILVLAGIIAFSILYIWFRMVEPERFLNPEGLSTMIEFIVRFDIPGSLILPSTWANEVIFSLIRGSVFNVDGIIALISTSIALLFLSALFIDSFYLEAFSRASEGRRVRSFGSSIISRLINARSHQGLSRTIMHKDLLEFIRQPAQWSQLILLLALLIVYIYNFKHFRNIQLTGLISQWGLYFLNMGLCGFVIAALGARFIFPAISLERSSFYLYKIAPVSMKSFIYSKFLIYSLPLTLSSLAVTVASNLILKSSFEYFVISLLMSFVIALVVSGLGISLGAIYPNFKEVDIASIPASIGGIIYMISSMTAIILLIGLTIWPTSFLRYPDYALRMGTKVYWIVGIHIFFIVLIVLFSTIYLLNYAAKRLEEYEQ